MHSTYSFAQPSTHDAVKNWMLDMSQSQVCGQCTKASRQCVPSPGVVFRHQQNASMNGSGTDDVNGGLKSFYGYKETFGKDSVWVAIPRN
ncbi:hypothetical protein KCV05_g18904, partial [Aureobasidium melanogenum]